jgi:hypothetical protein
MDYRYSIINECLGIVRQSDMPENSKLYLETLLYRVKLSLLKSTNNFKGTQSLDEYEGLISQAHAACGHDCNEQTVRDLTGSINVVISQLTNKNPQVTEGPFRGQLF